MNPSSTQVTRPRLGASLSHSVRLLRARAAATAALGAGIVFALLSLCCGIGVIMAPWLLCELLALQLGQALERPIPHSRAWISASVILLGAVLLTASVGWLSWLGLGTSGPAVDAAPAALMPRLGSAAGALAAASALVSLLFVLPFFYAPLILIESRAGLVGAVLESARLVAAGGAIRHVVLSLAVNLVQVLPVLLAALAAALLAEEDLVPLWVLFSLPLLSLSVPLGQGMLVSAYSVRRSELGAAAGAAHSGSEWRPAPQLVALWALLVAAPVLSFGMLGASLVRPSRLPLGRLQEPVEAVAALRVRAEEQQIHPAGTALEIAVSASAVHVTASDGGGAGRLPLRSRAPIEALRMVRARERYGLELMQGGRTYTTWIDRAGVRQDDDLRARLLDRVPTWALLAMLASLLSIASVLLPVLAALAELRRLHAQPSDARAPPAELAASRRRTLRLAYSAAIALTPLAALSLHWGARALLGV